MKVVYDEESLHNALSSKMRGLVPPPNSSKKFFQVKTYSDNSINICDSNLCISCQDVLSVLSSGDLGFYALSAKDYVNDYSCSLITLLSGSSVSEAFPPSLERELARSSSSSGEEVSRARADLLKPATPVSLSSVIFSSFGPMWGSPTAKHIGNLWLWEKQGLPPHPSLTTDSGSFESTSNPPIFDQFGQHKEQKSSGESGSFHFNESAPCVLSKMMDLGRSFSPTEASLNIPDFLAPVSEAGDRPQGTTDPSFKMMRESIKVGSLQSSATCNQYASFPTSKNQAAGKPGKFGFVSFSQTMIKFNRWGIPCGLGLLGGGESAANGWGGASSQSAGWGGGGGASNQANSQAHWGSGGPNRPSGPQTSNSSQSANLKLSQPPSNSSQPPISPANQQNNSSSSSAQQGPSNSQQQQQQASAKQSSAGQTNTSSNSWAQAAGKGLPSGNGSSDAQKLQNIKEALLSSEGWGGENVNQETAWDLPSSPEPGKDAATPHWKVNVNNGCDLWENNLRNGGAAPPKPQQTPWGQNPITNYGGTWGEDDESSDTSNVWTGAPANPTQWANNSTNPQMWPGGPPKKTPEWGPNAGWGEHGPPRPGVEPGAGDWGPHKAGPHPGPHTAPHPGPHPGTHPVAHTGPHPSSHPPGPHPVNHPVNHPTPHPGSHPGGPHGPTTHGPTTHGPTHGPGPHVPHGPGGPHGPGPYGPGPHGPGPHGSTPHTAPGAPGQWNNASKDIKPTGWEEPSPPSVRKDDGTAVWGNPGQQSSVSRWKEMANPNMMGRPGMAGNQQGRLPMPSLPGGPMKADQRMWGQQHGRNGSWGEAPHDTGTAVWGDDPKPGGWGEPPITSPSWVTKPKTPTGVPGSWPEPDMDIREWNNQNKKDEIEAVLRNNNIGIDETLLDLGPRAGAGTEVWRNPNMDDHASTPFAELGNPNYPQRFPPTPHQQLPLNSQLQSLNANPHQVRLLMHNIQLAAQAGYLNPQILNQPLAPNSLVLINNMLSQISVLQKLVQQHSLYQAQAHLNKNSSQPLLQLNVHIAKTKQQIQNLQNQIAAQQAMYVKQQQQQQQHHPQQQQQQAPSHLNSHLSGGGGPPTNAQNEFFKSSLPEHLYASFNQMNVETPGINSGPQPNQPQQQQQPQPQQHSHHHPQQQHQHPQQQEHSQQQGSRLNQWKLPTIDSDDPLMISNDFVRAPGKPSLPQSLPQSHSSPNLTPLLPGSNTAWSLSNRPTESGWPDSNTGVGDGGSPPTSVDKNALGSLESPWATSSQPGSGSYGLDIKPFEPGKQWMVKSIEDDPNITPGSVTRSPLTLGIKNSDILPSISKTTTSNAMPEMGSGGPLTSLSLSSNTWSFNPSGAGQTSSSSPLSSDSKLGVGANSKSSTWSDGSQGSSALASELWGAPGNKTRGPPPGMSGSNGVKQSLGANGGSWGGLGRSTSWSGDQQRNPTSALNSATSSSNPWPNSQLPSTWLILKNLTPQIDGSTLKTLCMQHGPLINFHLSLNHGFALVNYGSREEAAKAQGNLNNCLLSNTTILAEFATDSEVKQLLGQGAPPTPGAPSSSWGSSGRGSTPTSQSSSNTKVDSWGSGNGASLWGNGPTGTTSLWGGGNLSEGEQHRATPSSLKSYLPDGLLTSSESM